MISRQIVGRGNSPCKTKSELTENLKDLLKDIESREVPYIRKGEELLVA
jgi:hypothetical protein